MQTLTMEQVGQVSGGSWELDAAIGYAGLVVGTGAAIIVGVAGAPVIAGALAVGAATGLLSAGWITADHLLSK